MMLREITYPESSMRVPKPRHRLIDAGQNLEQGRFARAVLTNNNNTRVHGRRDVNTLKYKLVLCVAEADLIQPQYGPIHVIHVGKLQVNLLLLLHRLQLGQLLQLLDFALHRRSPVGIVAELVYKYLNMLPILQLGLVLPLLILLILQLCLQEVLVVAAVRLDLMIVQVQNLLRHFIQEAAIVRHNQQGTWPRLQIVLQPNDRLQVQHVRRLIQQQQVGLSKQSPRQRQSHPPATREVTRCFLLILGAEAEAAQDLRCSWQRLVGLARLQVKVDFRQLVLQLQDTVSGLGKNFNGA